MLYLRWRRRFARSLEPTWRAGTGLYCGLAVLATFTSASASAWHSSCETLAVSFFTARFLACTSFTMFYISPGWYLWSIPFFLNHFTLESHRIPFDDILLGLMYFDFKLWNVFATLASTFNSTVNALGKALTIKLKTFRFGATTLWSFLSFLFLIGFNFNVNLVWLLIRKI